MKILVDVGWPFSSDKMMVSCSACGLGMFVYLRDALGKSCRYLHGRCSRG